MSGAGDLAGVHALGACEPAGMSRRVLGTVGLGCLVACAVAQAPASAPPPSSAGGPDASAAVVQTGARLDIADGGPGMTVVAEASVASLAGDASREDDSDAGAKLSFDLSVARSGEVNVAVLVNVEAFRASNEGRQLGPVISTITKREDFFSHIDDLGVAWLLYTAPSLRNSAHGTMVMYCTAPDAKIDRWLDAKHAESSAPIDAGAGVHAVRTRVDRAERVFLRAQPHVVAMVPPELVAEAASVLRGARLPAHADAGEAFRFRARNPQRVMSELPASVTEARFWIAPRKDQGADFFFETDSSGATIVAQQLHDFLDREVDVSTRNATLGVFDHPEITASGNIAKVHIRATEAQLAAMLQIILVEFR
jgi:hypothetical protein